MEKLDSAMDVAEDKGLDAEIVEGDIGEIGHYDIEFKDGALCVAVDAKHALGSAGIALKLEAGAVLDALAKAIPGQIDDAVFGVIKAALLRT